MYVIIYLSSCYLQYRRHYIFPTRTETVYLSITQSKINHFEWLWCTGSWRSFTKWFWSCPSRVKCHRCEMQIWCIWSKLHCFPQTVDASSTAICCATQQLKFQTSIVGKNVEIVNLLCLVISLSVSRFIHHALVEFRRLWICWPSDTLQYVLANTSRFLVDRHRCHR